MLGSGAFHNLLVMSPWRPLVLALDRFRGEATISLRPTGSISPSDPGIRRIADDGSSARHPTFRAIYENALRLVTRADATEVETPASSQPAPPGLTHLRLSPEGELIRRWEHPMR